MFDHDQFHDPEFRALVRTARAVTAERVRRGIATPPERLAVAALDEMPDEDDPAAVRAWAPSAAFRDAVRSVVLDNARTEELCAKCGRLVNRFEVLVLR